MGRKASVSSSDPDVVTVDQKGTVNGKSHGTATVTCTVTDTAGNTAEGSCTVTVRRSLVDLVDWILHVCFSV